MTTGPTPEQSMPRVLIAGTDPALRMGIKMALVEGGIDVCGEVAAARELIEASARLDPDVCVIDVDLAGGGIAGAAELRARTPRPAVIMLAGDVREEDFLDAMRVGAAGYLLKSISPSRLPSVVRSVLRGEPAVPRALVATLIDRLRARVGHRHLAVPDRRGVDLTSREWEVLDLMREGLSTHGIATRLRISDVTVRRHIGSVLKKLEVRSREEAMKLLQSA